MERKAKTTEPVAQKLRWMPVDGGEPGVSINGHVLPWPSLKSEMRRGLLPQIDELLTVLASCDLVLRDMGPGRRHWLVRVVDGSGEEVAGVWLGPNPEDGSAWDGLVRVGKSYRPPLIWGTFQRFSDGSYRRIQQAGKRTKKANSSSKAGHPEHSRDEQFENNLKPPAMEQTKTPHAHLPKWIIIIASIITVLLIGFLMVAFFMVPQMSPSQSDIYKSLFAVLCALCSSLWGGTALLKLDSPKSPAGKFAVSATAGAAIFALTYIRAPYWFNSTSSEFPRLKTNGPNVDVSHSPGAVIQTSINSPNSPQSVVITEENRRYRSISAAASNDLCALLVQLRPSISPSVRLIISIENNNANRALVGQEINELLQAAGFKTFVEGASGVSFGAQKGLYLRATSDMVPAAQKLAEILQGLFDLKIQPTNSERYPNQSIELEIIGEPMFRSDGRVYF